MSEQRPVTPVYAIETRGLSKQFGALQVTDNVDFKLERGARHALIGPNGAGKTTFINLLTGALKPSAGSIFLGGEEITQESIATRVRRGLGRTFQITALFRALSVLDNVALVIAEREKLALKFWKPANHYHAVKEEAHAILEQLLLAEDAHKIVSDLPYGKQRLVEIAIALALKPKVLLLDEPAAGVPSLESGRILDVLDQLPKEIAILIIEHDMELVYRFAKSITVLVQGQVLVEGTPQDIASNQRVRDVYLGEAHA